MHGWLLARGGNVGRRSGTVVKQRRNDGGDEDLSLDGCFGVGGRGKQGASCS